MANYSVVINQGIGITEGVKVNQHLFRQMNENISTLTSVTSSQMNFVKPLVMLILISVSIAFLYSYFSQWFEKHYNLEKPKKKQSKGGQIVQLFVFLIIMSLWLIFGRLYLLPLFFLLSIFALTKSFVGMLKYQNFKLGVIFVISAIILTTLILFVHFNLIDFRSYLSILLGSFVG